MKKQAPERTPPQIEADLLEISRFYLTRVPIQEMVQRLAETRPYKISRPQVIYDLNTLRARWRAERIKNIDERQAEELAKLDQLETEYWDAWRRSQQETQQTKQEAVDVGKEKMALSKAIVTKTSASGDPRFLDGVMKCIDKRCEILGLNAPVQVEQSGSLDVTVTAKDFDLPHVRNAYREKLKRDLLRN